MASWTDMQNAIDAVRRLHYPSPDRDSTCDCVNGLEECPTIAALDRILGEHTTTVYEPLTPKRLGSIPEGEAHSKWGFPQYPKVGDYHTADDGSDWVAETVGGTLAMCWHLRITSTCVHCGQKSDHQPLSACAGMAICPHCRMNMNVRSVPC